MSDRQQVFKDNIVEYDEKQLPKVVNFAEHRFVTIERDAVTAQTFLKGHKSMRGACNYLARAIEGCERFVPERILDLDDGRMHELDVFAFVAPKSVDAVAVMMPRGVATGALEAIGAWAGDEARSAEKLLQAALNG